MQRRPSVVHIRRGCCKRRTLRCGLVFLLTLFLLLCALGALCYGFYFKCVDWFEKI